MIFRKKKKDAVSLKVAVIGAGYVGIVSAYDYVKRGHKVLVIDIDSKKIESLNSGVVPFYEPNLEIPKINISFKSDYKELETFNPDVVIFAVGTPPNEIDGSSDLRFLFDATVTAARKVKTQTIFVVKSTVPPGTSAALYQTVINATHQNHTFVSNPEFLREGFAVEDVLNPSRIVIGLPKTSNEYAKQIMRDLYNNSPKIIWTDVVSAEIGKYAANAYLAMKVTYINQIADLTKAIGGNVDSIAHIMGTDDRIGPKFLRPSAGFGGSCFPKDVRSLIRTARNAKVPLSLVETLQESNEERKIQIANDLTKFFQLPAGRKDLIVYGVTFKSGTDDMRGSAAMTILPILNRHDVAFTIFERNDQFAKPEIEKVLPHFRFTNDITFMLKAINAYDGIIIMNDESYDDLGSNFIEAVNKKPNFKVADLRNALKLSNPSVAMWKAQGDYYSLGR